MHSHKLAAHLSKPLTLVLLLAAASAQSHPLDGTAEERPHSGITILDSSGKVIREDASAPTLPGAIVDVVVGPGGSRSFSPAQVTVNAGDTVRWTWGSDNHSVTSGDNCTADGTFCSPGDINCSSGTLSNTGFVYQHTFAEAGMYSYFCALHCFSGMTGTVEVTASPQCTPAPPDVVSWWAGEGNALDAIGLDNLNAQGGGAFAAGHVGQAFSLNGTNAFFRSADTANLNPTGPFSIAVWVRADPSQAFPQSLIIDKSHGFTDGTGWGMQTNPDGTACFFYGTGGNSFDFHGPCTNTSILDNQWHHLAGVWTGNEIRIFRDGILQNTLAFSTTPVGNTRAISIGAAWGGGTPTRFLKGFVDEAQFFNRALTPSEVQAIVNADTAGECRPALVLTSAASVKNHGSVFELPLPLTGTPGVESRGGAHTLALTFSNAIVSGIASVTQGTGSVSGMPTASSHRLLVNLTGVTDAQTITLTLDGASDAFGQMISSGTVRASFLLGDASGNGFVNAGDATITRSRAGQNLNATNFQVDFNVDGFINAADATIVRARSGQFVP